MHILHLLNSWELEHEIFPDPQYPRVVIDNVYFYEQHFSQGNQCQQLATNMNIFTLAVSSKIFLIYL